jgi:CheY-like chemotaxis protein
MRSVVLIHWKPAEAEAYADKLRHAGIAVEVAAPKDGRAVRALGSRTPDAFLIDLSRLPSQGQAVGIELRKTAGSRRVPLVFVGGDEAKVERVFRVLPDAAFLTWAELPGSLDAAIRGTPAKPANPNTMAGYSGTPLAKKLGIKAASVVALIGAPEGFEAKLDPLPDDVHVLRQTRTADRVLFFVDSQATLKRRFNAAARTVREGGGLWMIWPKKASGIRTDITETIVREFGLAAGWVDYKICAVDKTWSGLQFARRRRSPDAAGIGVHHGLTNLAGKGLAEIGQIRHHPVDAIFER